MGAENKCDCPFEPAAAKQRREQAIAELKRRANQAAEASNYTTPEPFIGLTAHVCAINVPV